LDSSSCVNGDIVVLENCIIVRKCLARGMHLITQPVHVLSCSNSAIKGNTEPTEHFTTILLPKPSQNLPRVSLLKPGIRIVGFLGCSPNVNSSWCREQREGRLIWPYHARISRFYGRDGTLSLPHLSITFSYQRFSNCNPTVDVGFVKPTSDSFRGNRAITSAVTCAAVVLWFLETILNVRRSLSVLADFAHCSSSLSLYFHDSCMPI
jgi:hypothetical protein